ncbi:SEC-C metal-binding domain-containing protein [Vulgatibacter incomptus]|uniref:Uncharacterized protein n=1 Tax=Vulgatibacter incomptus TaxID=1391653 RepID=A0A0K1PC95_9BACT|nr:SEC-C metal-binding domain-containing protein [Vulgatibacter incomptus]AKU91132.1 hypothetical protein AKJ08_1519 [Vulgatibacter incomptus]
MKTGRNAPCPCGSGKKFKFCCDKAAAAGKGDWSKVLLAVSGLVLLLGAVWMATVIIDSDAFDPKGLVWSAEHGHWHTADGQEAGGAAVPRAQPPGLPPDGKVWSQEHGHWHDAE